MGVCVWVCFVMYVCVGVLCNVCVCVWVCFVMYGVCVCGCAL
jgi:hypothetical protein